MVNLNVDYLACCNEITRLLTLQTNISSIAPTYRKIVAEIIIIRLFDILQDSISSIACKVICGANYQDGSTPILLGSARNMQAATFKMIHYGRRKPRPYLRWSKIQDIKENVRYLINPTDHFIRTLDNHGYLIEEMRRIRNRVAHNNTLTRNQYQEMVLRHYGAYLNAITPGTLLLSPRRKPMLVLQYLEKSRILFKELVKA
jgi:hypothetical protein